MNVGELLRERDRLIALKEEAKKAGPLIKQLNTLIALYGNDEKVALNGKTPDPVTEFNNQCPDCDRSFDTKQGVTMHRVKVHGYTKSPAPKKGRRF